MHRDIKPDNLLFKSNNYKDYELILADFGLAEKVRKSPLLFKWCGTPGYVGNYKLIYNYTIFIYH
jgi:serine/threonine protein kinase